VACLLAIALASCGDDAGLLSSSPPASPPASTTAARAAKTTVAPTLAPAAPTVTVPKDPCVLVTQQEAGAVAGRDVLPPEAAAAGTESPTCTFPTQVTGSIAQLEVLLGPGAQKFLEIDRDTLGHDYTDVADIGHEAHQEDGVLFFRVDRVWVALRLTTLNDDPTQATRLQDLARVVVARLTGDA
jgi:hypothetical protein